MEENTSKLNRKTHYILNQPIQQTIHNAWDQMPHSSRNGWQKISNQHFCLDKWGNQSTLTARRFFVKIAQGSIRIGEPIPTFSQFNTKISTTYYNGGIIDTKGIASVQLFTTGSNCYATIQAYVITGKKQEPIINHLPVLWGGRTDPNRKIEFHSTFFKHFPDLLPGTMVKLLIQNYNQSGWKGIQDNHILKVC